VPLAPKLTKFKGYFAICHNFLTLPVMPVEENLHLEKPMNDIVLFLWFMRPHSHQSTERVWTQDPFQRAIVEGMGNDPV